MTYCNNKNCRCAKTSSALPAVGVIDLIMGGLFNDPENETMPTYKKAESGDVTLGFKVPGFNSKDLKVALDTSRNIITVDAEKEINGIAAVVKHRVHVDILTTPEDLTVDCKDGLLTIVINKPAKDEKDFVTPLKVK